MAFGELVVLHSRFVSGQDSYGNDIYSAVDTETYGAFAPAGGAAAFAISERLQGRDTLTMQDTVYVLDAMDVAPEAIDQVTVRGIRYGVSGQPAVWVSPFSGRRAGIVIRLLAVTG